MAYISGTNTCVAVNGASSSDVLQILIMLGVLLAVAAARGTWHG
ncbi:MAG: hypothetical protein V1744_00330 [Candidatus Altiarchaeota archaeon]